MEDLEGTRKKLELLKTARQQLNDEYLQKNTDNYKSWVEAADIAWTSQGIKLPFDMPKIPTESDIVARALELYNASLPALVKAAPEPIEPAEPTEVKTEPNQFEISTRNYVEEMKAIFKLSDPKENTVTAAEENIEESELEEVEMEEFEIEEYEIEDVEMDFDEFEEEVEYREYEEELEYKKEEKEIVEVQPIIVTEESAPITNSFTPKFLRRQNKHKRS